MAYSVDTIRVRASVGGAWLTTDLVGGDWLLDDLYTDYSGAIVILSSDIAPGFFYYDIYAEIPNIANKNISVTTWLLSLDLRAIRLKSTPPNVTQRHVFYMDAMRANYNFERIASDRHPDMLIDDVEKADLRLSRDDTDYNRMDEFCLISVNGLFHYTEPTPLGLVAYNGVRGFETGRTFNVGIHSFTGLGRVTKIPVTADMVSRRDDVTPLRDVIRITHNANTHDKSVMIVIGGYLHSFDEVYSVHNGYIDINVKRFLLPERLFDALRRTDMESIWPLMNNGELRSVTKEMLYSDEFINAYLMNNTFIVIVDTPVIHKELDLLVNDGIPGIYTTRMTPNKPMMAGYNRVCEYIPQKEFNTWVLHCAEPHKSAFAFTTAYEDDIEVYDEQLYPGLEIENTHPYFLNLYVESLTVPNAT